MKSSTKILALLAGALTIASCSTRLSESEQIFIDMTEEKGKAIVALVKNGEAPEGLQYDENTCQLGYNSYTRTFKMIKDDGSYYYMVTLSEAPKEGKKVKATLKYTTKNDVVTLSGVKFHVSDIDSSTGIIRLWNESSGIGVSIVELK